ncbi:MAG: alpha/beta hydrolase [Bacteroidia bacterium]
MKKMSVFCGLSFPAITCVFFVLVAFSPALGQKNSEWQEYRDISYSENMSGPVNDLQKLNLVVPAESDNMPLLIWIGGGAWSYGDRNIEMDLAHRFAESGIAVASVGHRLSPAVWHDATLKTGIQHPCHVEDVASAVAWLHKHAAEYGYDPDKFFIGGYSSGAHLAALISLDSSYLHKAGLSTDIFKGVIPISGAYDILSYYEGFLSGSSPELAELHVKAVFGENTETFAQASPTSYLQHLSAPLLVMCDNSLYNYTRLLEDRIRETAFRDVRVMYAYNLSHGQLWRNLSNDPNSMYRNAIVDFIRALSLPG